MMMMMMVMMMIMVGGFVDELFVDRSDWHRVVGEQLSLVVSLALAASAPDLPS